MIFKEEEIMNTGNNSLEILEEANYVDIPIISPNTIAVCEASITDDVSVGVIRYSDIESLCEEYGLDYDEALSSIANTNNIDINALCIAVDESEVILDPSIVEDIPNVVINPISEDSLAYQYCEMLLEEYIELSPELSNDILGKAKNTSNFYKFTDLIATFLDLSIESIFLFNSSKTISSLTNLPESISSAIVLAISSLLFLELNSNPFS